MLSIRPITFKAANEFVLRLHRHHKPVQGMKFCISAVNNEEIVGVALTGRPVARRLDNGLTVEVTRLCTDGSPNVCSLLYGACWRIAREMGYDRIITYTLPSEGGVSLKAAGWTCLGERGGGNWNVPSRPRKDTVEVLQVTKLLWERKRFANK